ncbi:protein of unknown function [Streptomyces murinus]
MGEGSVTEVVMRLLGVKGVVRETACAQPPGSPYPQSSARRTRLELRRRVTSERRSVTFSQSESRAIPGRFPGVGGRRA